MREVLTYARRGSRFSPAPAGGLGRARRGQWWIPDDAVDEPGFSWAPGSAGRRR